MAAKKKSRPRNKAKSPKKAKSKSPVGIFSAPIERDGGYRGQQLSLAFPGTVTQMGISFDRNLPYKQWAPVGQQLRKAKDWVNFAIGDWLNHGEGAYGEDYTQAAGETSMPPETLQVLKSISGAVPAKIRRIDKLSWSHHRLVAPAKYSIEEKVTWLERAIENDWGVRAMAEAMNPPKPRDEGETETTSGCECCGTSPAPMKTCSKCAAVASVALENTGIDGAIHLLKSKPSKPQLALLIWAYEHIKEPRVFSTDTEEAEWGARYEALKKTVEKGRKTMPAVVNE